MTRLFHAAAALLLAAVAHAQVSQPEPIRAGQQLGPWSETCITGVFVNGTLVAAVPPGERLTVPPLPPSMCGQTIRICTYVVCDGVLTSSDCTDYVVDCS